MVALGWASKEIAAALNISARTIDAHRAKIAEKLGTSSVAEFVRLTMADKGPA
ncbi:Tetrathionate response regulatory protein TtrR [compost metagenome]